MKVNVTGLLVKGILFLLLLGVIVLGFGGYLAWKEYQAFVSAEKEKNYVQVVTVKGDLLQGSLEKLKNGELLLTHQGVKVYFQPEEIATTSPLSNEEKEELIQYASKQHLKEKLKNFSSIIKKEIPRGDEYFTPEVE